MASRSWRLNHLYWIKNKAGERVQFKLNWAQEECLENLANRNLDLKVRQLGITTFWCIFELDAALFTDNLTIGIIAHTKDDAMKIMRDKILFAYDNLPEWIRHNLPLEKRTDSEIIVGGTKSQIRCGVTFRGGTPQILHITEYGYICARNPARAQEVRAGALEALPANGIGIIESTAMGRSGHFFDLVQNARKGNGDWELTFLPWWKHPEYQRDPEGITLTMAEFTYFRQLKMQTQHTFTKEQRAWYVMKLRELGVEEMRREYPSTEEEAFQASTQGAYYMDQMLDLHQRGRITTVPIERGMPVETWWDLGLNDSTAIWFVQYTALECRVINYYEASGEPYAHYAGVLMDFAEEHRIRYSKHWAPHDGAHRQQGVDRVQRRMDLAREAGIEWEIVPLTRDFSADIEAVRRHLPLCWFDESRCAQGIEHLEHYRKQWDERNGCYRSQPVHDNASHAADAFRTGVTAKYLRTESGPMAESYGAYYQSRPAGDAVAGY